MSRLNIETSDFKFTRQNWAPGTRRGVWRLRDLQVERPGPPCRGARVRYLAAGAQLSFSRLRLVCKHSRDSVNTSTYVLSANRLCESCQRPLVRMLLRLTVHSLPPCPQGAGVDMGTASPIERGLGDEGRQVQATFQGEGWGRLQLDSTLRRGPPAGNLGGCTVSLCSHSEQLWV